MVNDRDCKGIEFPVSKKDFSKIEKKYIYIYLHECVLS